MQEESESEYESSEGYSAHSESSGPRLSVNPELLFQKWEDKVAEGTVEELEEIAQLIEEIAPLSVIERVIEFNQSGAIGMILSQRLLRMRGEESMRVLSWMVDNQAMDCTAGDLFALRMFVYSMSILDESIMELAIRMLHYIMEECKLKAQDFHTGMHLDPDDSSILNVTCSHDFDQNLHRSFEMINERNQRITEETAQCLGDWLPLMDVFQGIDTNDIRTVIVEYCSDRIFQFHFDKKDYDASGNYIQ